MARTGSCFSAHWINLLTTACSFAVSFMIGPRFRKSHDPAAPLWQAAQRPELRSDPHCLDAFWAPLREAGNLFRTTTADRLTVRVPALDDSPSAASSESEPRLDGRSHPPAVRMILWVFQARFELVPHFPLDSARKYILVRPDKLLDSFAIMDYKLSESPG
jgi:hypothetical protein